MRHDSLWDGIEKFSSLTCIIFCYYNTFLVSGTSTPVFKGSKFVTVHVVSVITLFPLF